MIKNKNKSSTFFIEPSERFVCLEKITNWPAMAEGKRKEVYKELLREKVFKKSKADLEKLKKNSINLLKEDAGLRKDLTITDQIKNEEPFIRQVDGAKKYYVANLIKDFLSTTLKNKKNPKIINKLMFLALQNLSGKNIDLVQQGQTMKIEGGHLYIEDRDYGPLFKDELSIPKTSVSSPQPKEVIDKEETGEGIRKRYEEVMNDPVVKARSFKLLGEYGDRKKGIQPISAPFELLSATDRMKLLSSYGRCLKKENREAVPSTGRLHKFQQPPEGFESELSQDEKSFQYFLENYPLEAGNLLEYSPDIQDYLKTKMRDKNAMDSLMKKIASELPAAMISGKRLSKKYLDDKFSNHELMMMFMGWRKGVDIREVNYAKSMGTDGKLNFSLLNNQDCVDSCLRLRIEYLLSQKRYKDIEKMGIRGIGPNTTDEEINRKLVKYFLKTHTSKFSLENHQIADKLDEAALEKSNLELEVGDYITFNKGNKRGGHTVIVVAKARNNKGECVYKIATGTLPATEMALYKGWIRLKDLIGGSEIASGLANMTGDYSAGGIKPKGHTVSIGSLDMKYRNQQKAQRKKRR